MKTRSILPFAVFGILLIALFALSSCNGDGNGDGGSSGDEFGGPYAFGWRMDDDDRMEFGRKKKDDIQCYKDTNLSVSQAIKLTDIILSKYMEADLFDIENMQKYNYVIDMDGNIIVAQWQEDVNFENFRNEQQGTGAKDGCTGRQCLGDGDSGSTASKETIVNLISEDKKADPMQSPCWLDRAKGKGLLDAISKHLMLAQGVGTNGVGDTIQDFNGGKWATEQEGDWMQAKVRYAGEFTVDVGNNCIFNVNGDSGTYRPETSYQTLKKVWGYFGNTFKLCN